MFSGLAEIRVGIIAEIVANDDHVLDGGQILLGEPGRDIDFPDRLRHDRHGLLHRGLLGPPEQQADDGEQHDSRHTEDQGQLRLLLRQRVKDALGGMCRVPP